MNLKVKQAFDWAHHGVAVVSYAVGDEIETDDQDLIEVALREGWAVDQAAKRTRAKAEHAPQ